MRRFLLFVCVFMSMIAMLLSAGCSKAKVYTIGIVNTNPGLVSVVDGFKSGMAGFKYVEGNNVVYINKGTLKTADEIDAALKELIERKVDLILAITTLVAQRAKLATEGNKTPVVFAPVFVAPESGLVKSLRRPGGNLTGIQMGGNTQKALEWHKTAIPFSKRIFVPLNPDEKAAAQSLSDLKKSAEKLGIELTVAEISSQDDLKSALNNIPKEADSIWLLNSAFFVSNASLFEEAAIKRRLPLSSGTSQLKSVLISYGQKPYKTGEQASRLAHSIFEGVSPSELPVETVNHFLGVNLKMARKIGVNIPDQVLQQADDIIR